MAYPVTQLIYNANGSINLQLDHPIYGWIPFTASPYDTVQMGKDLYSAAVAGTLIDYSTGVVAIISPYVQTLTGAQTDQLYLLANGYANAIVQPVSYTSVAGVIKTYQADKVSQYNLLTSLQRASILGSVPTGFYWVASDNTQVPFTLTDLTSLDSGMWAQGWAAFQHLQTQKASVMAATTVTTVQSIVW